MIANTDIIIMDFSEFNEHYILSGLNHPNGHPEKLLQSGRVSVIMKPASSKKELLLGHVFPYVRTTFVQDLQRGIEKFGDNAYTILLRIDGLMHKELHPQYHLAKESSGWVFTRATPYVQFALSEHYTLLGLKTPGTRVSTPVTIQETLKFIRDDISDKVANGQEDIADFNLSKSVIRVTAFYGSSEISNTVVIIDYEHYRALGPVIGLSNMMATLSNTFNNLRCACKINQPPVAFFKVDFIRKGQFGGDDDVVSGYVFFDNQGESTVINSDISPFVLRDVWLLNKMDVTVNAVEDIIFKLGDDYYSATAVLDEEGTITINDKTPLTRNEFKRFTK